MLIKLRNLIECIVTVNYYFLHAVVSVPTDQAIIMPYDTSPALQSDVLQPFLIQSHIENKVV